MRKFAADKLRLTVETLRRLTLTREQLAAVAGGGGGKGRAYEPPEATKSSCLSQLV
jgi:hypothetical protein